MRELLKQYPTHSKCFFQYSYFHLMVFLSCLNCLCQHPHGIPGCPAATSPGHTTSPLLLPETENSSDLPPKPPIISKEVHGHFFLWFMPCPCLYLFSNYQVWISQSPNQSIYELKPHSSLILNYLVYTQSSLRAHLTKLQLASVQHI